MASLECQQTLFHEFLKCSFFACWHTQVAWWPCSNPDFAFAGPCSCVQHLVGNCQLVDFKGIRTVQPIDPIESLCLLCQYLTCLHYRTYHLSKWRHAHVGSRYFDLWYSSRHSSRISRDFQSRLQFKISKKCTLKVILNFRSHNWTFPT